MADSNITKADRELRPQTPKLITKRSLRMQTWKKLRALYNRFPIFVDSDKAAAALAETEEFKKAHNVFINHDRVLNPVKLEAYFARKIVYLTRYRKSKVLYLRLDEPADYTDELRKTLFKLKCLPTDRTEITLEDAVTLDMIIIESVVVSRNGYRIGCGNGLVDQDIGLLIEIGSITPETVIATVVDDLQVVATLPKKLFKKHDVPVDLIVTPTEVIRVAKRLPRPAGLYWELLSKRRVQLVPYFECYKEYLEKCGNIINLKQTDTDDYPLNRFTNLLKSDTEQQASKNDILRYDEICDEEERKPLRQRGKENCQHNAEPEGGRKVKNHPIRNFCNKVSSLFRGIRGAEPTKESRNGNNGDGGEGGEGGSDKKENNEQANNAFGYGGNARI